MLGYLTGMSNAAILTDKGALFEADDIDFYNIEDHIKKNKIYLQMSSIKIPHITENVMSFLYDDYLQLLPVDPSNKTLVRKVELFRQCLQPLPMENARIYKDFNKYLAARLYRLGLLEYDPYSALRLGDFLFQGVIEQNYPESLKVYEQATKMGFEDQHVAQAYFNMGYMYQHGIGVEKDLNKSWEYYNKSANMNPEAYLPVMSMKLGLDFELSYSNSTQNDSLAKIDFLVKGLWKRYSPLSSNVHLNVIGLVVFLIVVLNIYRLRLKNYLESMQPSRG
jgi:TPR repeat protein